MSDVSSQVPEGAFQAGFPGQVVPPTPPRRLRLWPGVVIVALMWAVTQGFKYAPIENDFVKFMAIMWAPMVATALLLLWWLAFSRLRWTDRLFVPVMCAVPAVGAMLAADVSVGGMVFILYALPWALTAFVGWLLIAQVCRIPIWRLGLLAVLTLVFGYYDLVRFDGVTGSFQSTFSWRWDQTAEERYLAQRAGQKGPGPAQAEPVVLRPGDWPIFRGEGSDSRVTGTHLATNWDKQPPRELWRKRVGPGWGSFAVVGKRVYTQEQRGEKEVVVCWDADSGNELWVHEDAARFTEPVAGPGPRATPTFHDGKIYAQGAAGRLNCLDAATGQVIWYHDIGADSGVTVPQWGFSASPLVVDGLVSVFAGGPDGKSVLAYKAATGEPVWQGGEGTHSYCSTQLAKLKGVEQLLVASDAGVVALEPKTGKALWKQDWKFEGARCCQVAVLDDTDVMFGTPFSQGSKRFHLTPGEKGWDVKEVWFSKAISPYYNDFVVHKGNAYGFDGNFLTCVNLDNGKRRWRERGYDNGQVVLLADQDLLLVVSEQGDIALVAAAPEAHRELARIKAISGKTWNHPVVAHGRVYVRNGEEAACFELPQTTASQPADTKKQ